MSTFRTELQIDENPNKIHYNSKILSIGSGFSNVIADPLLKYKFNVNCNPYGKIYNPLSIFNLIDMSVNNKPIDERLITEKDGAWSHFDFYLREKCRSKKELIELLRRKIEDTHTYIKRTDFLIITFASGFVYKLNSTKHVVANCHRAPTNSFEKELLTPFDIVEGFRKIYNSLNHITDIILVVSPVMHTKDSIMLNAVGKSVLRVATHMMMYEFPSVKYFPAYEFLLSDLRDYRFYKEDYLHPNELAVDYIFNKFVDSYMDEESRNCIDEVEQILEAVEHVPYNPQNEEYQKYISNAITKVSSLSSKMNLSGPLKELESKLL